MKVLLIDNGSTLLPKLEQLIPGEVEVKLFNELDQSDIHEFDLLVLSGSSTMQLEGNNQRLINETNIILNSNKPVIGICFGCEIIVTAFNGKLRRLDSPHVGLRNISIRNSDKENTVKNIQVYEHHQWIIDKVPDNFRIIAWTEDGPEMIRHNQLPIFGIQFHPENLTNQTDGDEIFFQILREINLI